MSTKIEFYKKFSEIQSKVKIGKNKYNDFGKYKYRNAEEILDVAKPLLNECGFVILMSDESRITQDSVRIKSVITITDGEHEITTFADVKEPESKKGMDAAQVSVCSSSYARKAALCGIFGIGEEDNDDTEPPGKTKKESSQEGAGKERGTIAAYKRLCILKESDPEKANTEFNSYEWTSQAIEKWKNGETL